MLNYVAQYDLDHTHCNRKHKKHSSSLYFDEIRSRLRIQFSFSWLRYKTPHISQCMQKSFLSLGIADDYLSKILKHESTSRNFSGTNHVYETYAYKSYWIMAFSTTVLLWKPTMVDIKILIRKQLKYLIYHLLVNFDKNWPFNDNYSILWHFLSITGKNDLSTLSASFTVYFLVLART